MSFNPAEFDLDTPHRATSSLLQAGISEAIKAGYSWHQECSDISESRYLKVLRDSFWWGFRISSHEPVYRSSGDYLQILIPQRPDKQTFQHAVDYLLDAMHCGGKVVASPTEVLRAFETLLAAKTATNSAAYKENKLAAEANPEPQRINRNSFTDFGKALSSIERCAIRHRLNHRAQWTYDELASEEK